jgi:aminopeptidase
MDSTKLSTYQPSKKILQKYADVMVNYALHGGKGVKKGEVVMLEVPECAKPMLIALQEAVLKAGAHPLINYIPDEVSRDLYVLGNDAQIEFFPATYIKARVDQMDHLIRVIADSNMQELKGVDAKKIMTRQKSFKPYMEWRDVKETAGKFSWTLCLYGTQAMAKEAGLDLYEYWMQIRKACYLNDKNPVQTWQKIQSDIENYKRKLNALKIETLHIKSKNTDLTVKLGENRKWLGGSGRNIPSFELFISPDWRGTNGYIYLDQPLYRYGSLVKDIRLEFKDGQVIKASAKYGEKVLKEMLMVENANKIGEYSLTDSRFSKITKFMASTLFDENVGGKYGNTHIALGSAYKDSFTGDATQISEKEWKEMGYNQCSIHCDVISTENRVVTAKLHTGSELVIYRDGKFQL